MKKVILITCTILLTISLAAFGIMNWKDSEIESSIIAPDAGLNDDGNAYLSVNGFQFIYAIDSRFSNVISEDRLHNAESIFDIIARKDNESLKSYYNILVTDFAESRKDWISERGLDENLNTAQQEILKSLHYGSSFSITGNINKLDEASGKLVKDTIINYMTIVPENPAIYVEGHEALISYLQEKSKNEIIVADNNKIQPGKVSFIVNIDGGIESVSLDESSGYDSIDKKMVKVIKAIPGNWHVATNQKGEKVNHGYVFFFGDMGC